MESREGVGRGGEGGFMREDSSSFFEAEEGFFRGGIFCNRCDVPVRFSFY